VGTDEFLKNAMVEDAVDFELINYTDAVHGFDMVNDNLRTRETIRSTTDFFKRVLSLP
jgi:hypothetical protein